MFKLDEEYVVNEEKYATLKKEILDDDGESSGEDGDGEGEESGDEEGADGAAAPDADAIIDKTETNLVALRRTIYLTIQSSLDFEECAHKMLRMNLKEGNHHTP